MKHTIAVEIIADHTLRMLFKLKKKKKKSG